MQLARSTMAGWILLTLTGCSPLSRNERAAVIRDSFTAGKPELTWRPYPFFNRDNLAGQTDPSSPEGDSAVGLLDNRNAGGFAALSYAETRPLRDFDLETWIHVQISTAEKGSLNGIAFRVDPVQDKYYRFAAQFAADPSLSLAYVGRDTKHFPVTLAEWKGASLPSGNPKQNDWHHLIIQIRNDAAEIFWDSVRLPGGPFRLQRIESGYVGVYATFTGGLGIAETKVDRLRIRVHRFDHRSGYGL
jgi:hypothetical protein